MVAESPTVAAWRAPYVSYETLTNFLEKRLADRPLPPRIDLQFLDNYAGSIRPLLLAALKAIGLVGENNEVLPLMQTVVIGGPSARKSVLTNWAQTFYGDQLELAAHNSTASQLWESFARHHYTGSTLRKAVVFYLNLVKDTGLPNSPHFKAPRAQATGAPRKARPKPTPATEAAAPETRPSEQSSAAPSEQKIISFGSAGEVTLLVRLRWLDLPDEVFVGLRQAIREIEHLGTPIPEAAHRAGAASTNSPE